MSHTTRHIAVMALLACTTYARGQDADTPADTMQTQQLQGLTVTARRHGTVRDRGAVGGVTIRKEELFKAACCNLGESFTTNPSVDVNYTDATTGARQIKLLGLSGTYVQMLTENLPNFRGAAMPYALGYVPGPWMNSIMVSKGASSVRNGFESISGQIDVEYLKPEDEQGATINLFGDSRSRLEANADANLHLTSRLNAELLAHHENDWGHHDDNHDGFRDKPGVRQTNLQSRWDYLGRRYIFHGGAALLDERRQGGQTAHAAHATPYVTDLDTRRYEAYMKHAFVLDPDHATNIAIMASGAVHHQHATYGNKHLDVDDTDAYAQLMFETSLSAAHQLSAGLSLTHDHLANDVTLTTTGLPLVTDPAAGSETTPGVYAQYTLNLDDRLTLMAGLRADHSSRFGTFVTPRLHLKLSPSNLVSVRLSAGKGYRSPRALVENMYLVASGRRLVIDSQQQEAAWNCGLSTALTLPVGRRTLRLNAEYFYTHFDRQTIIDYDTDPSVLHIANLQGRSYAHTLQADASCEVADGLELTAAYRLNHVRTTYGHRLMEKPLTSRYKGLLTASYKTPLGLWQFDATLQLNGGGRMPTPVGGLWAETFLAYAALNVQATRWFRHFSVYVGGENLTGYTQKTTIIAADDPWSTTFDPTMVWGPVHGRMLYAGLRINLGRRL